MVLRYIHKSRLLIPLLMLCITISCKQNKTTQVGGDRDKHGCIASAGYTWSEVRKDCIRIFEAGTALKNAQDTNATLAAYAVFSPDYTKVELFLPDVTKHDILNKEGDSWSNKRYKLVNKDGHYQLFEADKLIYEKK
ncbi:MAG: hypothetical protein ACRDDZ_09015 [Marinifilaceae bacterium]